MWHNLSILLRQLSSDEDVVLRFDGIRQSEEDRTRGALVPELSQITADRVSHNLLVSRLCDICAYTL